MSDSILNSTKKALGLAADYTAFDADVMMLTNSALSTLTQLGVGPAIGFMITDAEATWDSFLGVDPVMNMAKTFVFLKVKLAFDPPEAPPLLTSLEKQVEELSWRLNVHRETTEWTDPTPTHPEEDVFGGPLIIDGGVG